MKLRSAWNGWELDTEGHILDDGAGRISATSKSMPNCRSVTLPRLTEAFARVILPSLQHCEVIQLSEPDVAAVAVLAELPRLSGIHFKPQSGAVDPERYRQFVAAVATLPGIRSLFLQGEAIPELSVATGLRALAVWTHAPVTDAGLSAIGSLPALQELRVLASGRQPTSCGPKVLDELSSRGVLRDVHLEGVAL
ncbi:MAG: hypothetical protein WCJ30_17220, partial [Deltaproteobacteria bacterium]